jgi:hypothetical protein
VTTAAIPLPRRSAPATSIRPGVLTTDSGRKNRTSSAPAAAKTADTTNTIR